MIVMFAKLLHMQCNISAGSALKYDVRKFAIHCHELEHMMVMFANFGYICNTMHLVGTSSHRAPWRGLCSRMMFGNLLYIVMYWNIYKNVYIHMCVYIYTYIYIYIHTYRYIYICIYMCILQGWCVNIYINIYMYIYIYVHIFMYMYIHLYIAMIEASCFLSGNAASFLYAKILKYIYVNIYIHIYIYVCVNIYVYTHIYRNDGSSMLLVGQC